MGINAKIATNRQIWKKGAFWYHVLGFNFGKLCVDSYESKKNSIKIDWARLFKDNWDIQHDIA